MRLCQRKYRAHTHTSTLSCKWKYLWVKWCEVCNLFKKLQGPGSCSARRLSYRRWHPLLLSELSRDEVSAPASSSSLLLLQTLEAVVIAQITGFLPPLWETWLNSWSLTLCFIRGHGRHLICGLADTRALSGSPKFINSSMNNFQKHSRNINWQKLVVTEAGSSVCHCPIVGVGKFFINTKKESKMNF